ncbi:hypothetical protein BDW02DRAFT_182307 [Decorospora gaudefroyi]|uniref:Uncharacterized protein n=1 Tax=Decorospora gaudefroyi TaxID=184978 RepID=A0A6A5KRX1_9PLEO|nr:hypothetical protein BDW02DRAFT_182307 [Decorospora gaudefroyi]
MVAYTLPGRVPAASTLAGLMLRGCLSGQTKDEISSHERVHLKGTLGAGAGLVSRGQKYRHGVIALRAERSLEVFITLLHSNSRDDYRCDRCSQRLRG